MIKIKANKKLFDEWVDLAEGFESICMLAATTIQNNMEIEVDQIMDWDSQITRDFSELTLEFKTKMANTLGYVRNGVKNE